VFCLSEKISFRRFLGDGQMTDQLMDLENNIDLDDTEIGKKYLFWVPNAPDNAFLSFSSTLENIGIMEKHDCLLKNKTEVLVLSDPTEANHASMGPILVSRIMAHTIMWVATASLHIIDE
jgi:hypothetical protein